MLAISNEEIDALRPLGKSVKCWNCGRRHRVQFGKVRQPDGTWKQSNSLAFFRCGGESYLCGIAGKAWRPRDV